MQQLDDVNQQLNAARTLLKNSEKDLAERQSVISQTESSQKIQTLSGDIRAAFKYFTASGIESRWFSP